ncbi:MAG: two-component system, OmpR family, response regulator QseB [Microbacteriaceae bacterium]|jgi:two-component system response regulator QseB|nr:two-component system, OmpR family, response regulator QseB [Microbacteriaceae bacterium]
MWPRNERARPLLLLVEDDPRLGPLIQEVLSEAYSVTLVADGAEGLSAALHGLFELIVLDRRLPGLDGLEVVRRVRAAGRRTPILVLSALGTIDDRVDGLDSGANDYLVKPFDIGELLARLRALRRASNDEPVVLDIGGWRFYPEGRALFSPKDERVVLTAKECGILRLLAESPDREFTAERILTAVFPEGDKPGVVRTNVHYIRAKTNARMIATVRGVGYRLGRP